MLRNYSYNFYKLFFRRPYWTYLNILFLKFFIASAAIILSLTLLSIRFVNRIPEHRIRFQAKQIYVAHLIKQYQQFPVANPILPHTPDAVSVKPSKILPVRMSDKPASIAEFIEQSIEKVDAALWAETNRELTVQQPETDSTWGALLNSSSATRLKVRNAIENVVAPAIETPLPDPLTADGYQGRRQAYQNGLEMFVAESREEVALPKVSFTDFQILQGTRNEEKTIAIANENKQFVRQCIEKLTRNDPGIKGHIIIRFTIHPEGYVIPESVKILQSNIQDDRVLRCIKRNIRRWKNFPRVAYEKGIYSLTQKYIF